MQGFFFYKNNFNELLHIHHVYQQSWPNMILRVLHFFLQVRPNVNFLKRAPKYHISFFNTSNYLRILCSYFQKL